jgi:hypothetical protein
MGLGLRRTKKIEVLPAHYFVSFGNEICRNGQVKESSLLLRYFESLVKDHDYYDNL